MRFTSKKIKLLWYGFWFIKKIKLEFFNLIFVPEDNRHPAEQCRFKHSYHLSFDSFSWSSVFIVYSYGTSCILKNEKKLYYLNSSDVIIMLSIHFCDCKRCRFLLYAFWSCSIDVLIQLEVVACRTITCRVDKLPNHSNELNPIDTLHGWVCMSINNWL